MFLNSLEIFLIILKVHTLICLSLPPLIFGNFGTGLVALESNKAGNA